MVFVKGVWIYVPIFKVVKNFSCSTVVVLVVLPVCKIAHKYSTVHQIGFFFFFVSHLVASVRTLTERNSGKTLREGERGHFLMTQLLLVTLLPYFVESSCGGSEFVPQPRSCQQTGRSQSLNHVLSSLVTLLWPILQK